jgi:hypothetical protein
MAKLGDILLKPELGWKRYDDSHEGLTYTGEWYTFTSKHYYKGQMQVTDHYTTNNYITFKFYGTAIRIIGDIHEHRHSNNTITIDNVTETFSEFGTATGISCALVYEKTGLSLGVHSVIIKSGTDNKNFTIDAIDIDEDGYLIEPVKYLIKQYDGKYYSIKPEYYNNHINNFIPLELYGGSEPNTNDIMNYGFDDVRNIYNNMTVNNNIFRPIDKLYDRFEIKKYSFKPVIIKE